MTHAVIRATGEVLDLSAPTGELAAVLDHMAAIEAELRTARELVRQELCGRLDRDNQRRTMTDDGWFLEVDAPGQTEWDTGRLAGVLEGLVSAGKLSAEAARAALEPVRVLKPRRRELAKLAGLPQLSDDDREALSRCEHPTGRQRRVTVKRHEKASAA